MSTLAKLSEQPPVQSGWCTEARFWIRHPEQTDLTQVRSEYIQAVKERFDEAGIDMPYPYQQLTGRLEIQETPPRPLETG